MPMPRGFLLPDRLRQCAVQLQACHCGAANGTDSDQARAVPTEMKTPRIAPRIEQAHGSSRMWIRCGLARAFAKRAGNASQGQIA
jgi:hypothetical protein